MNYLLIGAGGVATYFNPGFVKALGATEAQVLIIDKDTFEEKNFVRQIFNPDQTGMFKARVACTEMRRLALPGSEIRVGSIIEWFHPDLVELENYDNPDVIFCMADNHRARRDACALAERHGCSVIIGGNEYATAQAMFWHPSLGKANDPRFRYNLESNEGSPIRCNTDEALVSTPQLAMANMTCAAFMLNLWHIWVTEKRLNDKLTHEFLPIELMSTASGVTQINTILK